MGRKFKGIFLSVILTLSFSVSSAVGQGDYLEKADLAFHKTLFPEAEELYRKAAVQFLNTDRQKYFRASNRLGDVLRLSGKEHEAEQLLRKTELQIEKEYPNSVLLAECYDILGELYFYISDVERAGDYFKKALLIKQRLLKDNDARLAFSISNVGRYYNFKQKHSLALKYTQRAYKIITETPTNLSEIVPELIYCEHAYSIKSLFQASDRRSFSDQTLRPIYYRAIEEHQKRRGIETFWLAYLYHYLGNTYTDEIAHGQSTPKLQAAVPGQLRAAMANYLNAERIFKKFLPRHNPRLSMTYYVMGLVNDYSSGDPKVSIAYYNKALKQALPATNQANEGALLQAFNQHQVLSLVSWKIKAFHDLFKVKGDLSWGQEILEQTDLLNQIWLKMRSEYQLNKYQGITTFYYRPPYDAALNVCYELGRRYPGKGFEEKALAYMELSKLSPRLSFNIKDKAQAQKYLRSRQIALSRAVHTVQERSAIVSYYDPRFYSADTDRRMFIALVTKGQVKLFASDFSKAEKARLDSFISNFSTIGASEYRKYSYSLYQKLLGFKLDPTIKHLKIIPGVAFSHQIPFSALPTSTAGTSFKTMDYLLNKYSISWGMSIVEQRSQQAGRQRGLLYVSPGNSDYSALPFSQLLINTLAGEYPGKIIQGAEGTAEVLQEFPKFNIVHLAAHGVANDEDPDSSYLVFSDRKVYSSEIYQMSLNAALVNLSACETVRGVSSAENGSVMNFVRAFHYAGAKSITSTLWKVDDEMTAKIYKEFFDGLAQGWRKDISLQRAKLNYLHNCSEAAAHPYYWAGVVLYGEADKITIKKKSSKILVTLIATLIAVIALAFLIRKKLRVEIK